MTEDAQINFGWFVRHSRAGKFSLGEFAEALDMTPRRMSQIEISMREPSVYPDTMSRIAAKLGYGSVGEFETAWRSTPVPRPKFKESPKGESVLIRVRVSKAVAEALRAVGQIEVVSARILTESVGASSPAASRLPQPSGFPEPSPVVLLNEDDERERAAEQAAMERARRAAAKFGAKELESPEPQPMSGHEKRKDPG